MFEKRKRELIAPRNLVAKLVPVKNAGRTQTVKYAEVQNLARDDQRHARRER